MNKYGLYNRVLEAKNEDEGTFTAVARNWIEGAETAEFNNEEANQLFADAKRYCSLWRNKAINGKVSKLRMVACVKKIAEMDLPNPYDKNEPEPVVEEPKAEEPKESYFVSEIAAAVEEIKQEPIKVLGVLPEDDFTKEDLEEKIEEVAEKVPTDKIEEKHFFGKRNKKR